eukprot:365032-Chlamydomonas_euryale.AAC.13
MSYRTASHATCQLRCHVLHAIHLPAPRLALTFDMRTTESRRADTGLGTSVACCGHGCLKNAHTFDLEPDAVVREALAESVLAIALTTEGRAALWRVKAPEMLKAGCAALGGAGHGPRIGRAWLHMGCCSRRRLGALIGGGRQVQREDLGRLQVACEAS